jgi:hypothetical protein
MEPSEISALDLIDQYAKEIEMDTNIDRLNVMDKQLSSPNIKHKWLFRVIKVKRNLLRLQEAKEMMILQEMESNTLRLSKAIIMSRVESNVEAKKLTRQIKEHELLIEYLDRAVDKIFSQMGFDFRNLVELIKLETL